MGLKYMIDFSAKKTRATRESLGSICVYRSCHFMIKDSQFIFFWYLSHYFFYTYYSFEEKECDSTQVLLVTLLEGP